MIRSSRLGRVARTAFSPELVTGGLDYFEYQVRLAQEVVLPWLRPLMALDGAVVGDFGCHEGGVLEGLRESEVASAVGIEINEAVVHGSRFVPDYRFRIEIGDLTAIDREPQFDLVLLHDVLEHVVDCTAVLEAAQRALLPGGRIFVSFPPYWSPYGGHQHLAASHARSVPYLHYLPSRLFYRLVSPADNVYMNREGSIEDLVSVRQTRLSLAKAESSFRAAGLRIASADHFILRPEYTVRYGLPTVRAGVVARLTGIREVLVSGAFYLLADAASRPAMSGASPPPEP